MRPEPDSSNGGPLWSEFDPQAYVDHYYKDPHADDELAAELCCKALGAAYREQGSLDVVDVGTGSNLFPILCALPYCRSVTAWEYAPRNVAWLRAQRSRSSTPPEWRHFWNVVRGSAAGFDLPEDPAAWIGEKMTVQAGSIFELPERKWDAATMFFCAESITSAQEEFERACRRFAACTKVGGSLVAAFLCDSRGYRVAGHSYPAVPLSEEEVEACFRDLASDLVIRSIGRVESEVRSGYSGMIFMTARSK